MKDGRHSLAVWVTDKETDKIELLAANGYTKIHAEPVRIFPYDKPFPEVKLPEGFTAISLAEESDYEKIHACLWKGFNRPQLPHGPDHSDQGSWRRLCLLCWDVV